MMLLVVLLRVLTTLQSPGNHPRWWVIRLTEPSIATSCERRDFDVLLQAIEKVRFTPREFGARQKRKFYLPSFEELTKS